MIDAVQDRFRRAPVPGRRRERGLLAGTLLSPNVLLALATMAVAAFFTAYAANEWLSSEAGYGLVAVETGPAFSSKAGWLPLALEVSDGNLFPAATELGEARQGLRFYPYLSLWTYGGLIHLFGVDLSTRGIQVVFPALAYLFSVLTFGQFVPRRWALFLAALGTLSFSGLPLRSFTLQLISGGGWRLEGVPVQPDLVGVPFPALSSPVFAALFYLTLRSRWLTPARATLLTVLWSLQTQVHMINALFGLPLWFTFLGLRLARMRGGEGSFAGARIRSFALQLGLAGLLCLPALYGAASLSDVYDAGVGHAAIVEASRGAQTWAFYFLAYFLLPLSLLGAAWWTRRVDAFEVFTKFWPVHLCMAVEFSLALSQLVLGLGVPLDLIGSRIGISFLHMLYFTPAVCYAVQPDVAYSLGRESGRMAGRVRRALTWLFGDASRVYLPALFGLLLLFGAATLERSARFHAQSAPLGVERVAQGLARLGAAAAPGDTLVADLPAINLNTRLAGRLGSLWPNRFSNDISENEAIDRLALSARILGWSLPQFLEFMLPPQARSGAPIVDLTESAPPPGLGYWLVYHYRINPYKNIQTNAKPNKPP